MYKGTVPWGGRDKCNIQAHSGIGGMVALEVARVRPDRLKGVISIEGWTSRDAADAFEDEMRNTLSADQEAKLSALRRRVMDIWTEEQVAEFARIWTRWDGYDVLSSSDLPVLELYGDRDRRRPSLPQLQIQERANIRTRWVSNASHFLPLERHRGVAAACSEFIRGIDRGDF